MKTLSSQTDKRDSERTRISLGVNYESQEDRFIDNLSAKIYTNLCKQKVTMKLYHPTVGRGGAIPATDSNTKVTLKQIVGGNIQFQITLKLME